MNLLVLDTTAFSAAVCLARFSTQSKLENSVVAVESQNRSGEAVIPLISDVLSRGLISLNEIDKIVVSIGPGSYTGIRVGIATAIGLGQGACTPVCGISCLKALLFPLAQEKVAITRIPANKNEDYIAAFSVREKRNGSGQENSYIVKELQAPRIYERGINEQNVRALGLVPEAELDLPLEIISLETNPSCFVMKIAWAGATGDFNDGLEPIYIKQVAAKTLAERGKDSAICVF